MKFFSLCCAYILIYYLEKKSLLKFFVLVLKLRRFMLDRILQRE